MVKDHKNIRKETLGKAKRIVVKVGSSILASVEKGLNHRAFAHLAREISELKHQGYEVVLVSSGAIAAGMGKLGYKTRPQSITQKQATAAVGQSRLMNIYESHFSRHQRMVAQVLLTRDDLSHRQRFLNARNTLLTLLDLGIVPIINENDTVVVDEIQFGDNDNLSALITNLIEADLLIILTDIDGLCDADPRVHPEAKCIPLVEDIDMDMGGIVGDTGRRSDRRRNGEQDRGRSKGIPLWNSHGHCQRETGGSPPPNPEGKAGWDVDPAKDGDPEQSETLDRFQSETPGGRGCGCRGKESDRAKREEPACLRRGRDHWNL